MDGDFLVIQLILGVVMGGITAAIAASKGRNAIGWFFAGFFGGIIGIIIVAVLPNLHEQQRRRQHADAERRRLREQLRQEKLKTEAFRRHAAGRLDAHDQVLGVDTRRSEALQGGTVPVRLGEGASADVAPPPPPPSRDQPEKQWYYESAGESHGPLPQSTLTWMLESGSVKPQTLVWTEGQTDWLPASRVPAFRVVTES